MKRLVAPSDRAYVRNALFAIELLDAVTLERVSQGVEVIAEGLHQRKPIVNQSGLFVWLQQDLGLLKKISIDPDALPYEKVEIAPADLQLPLMTIQLRPRMNYTFASGTTGMRGALIEERVVPQIPVTNAEVYLRWLDENSVWRDAPTTSKTDTTGNFAAFLRLAPNEVPLLDTNGALTVRLRARRDPLERGTGDLKLAQGRIADALIFVWDELQP